LISYALQAQNKDYARKVINDLCADEMAGRGYVYNGDKKAAEYIKKEYKQAGLLFFENDYYQNFGFPVNTFPFEVELIIDGRELVPGDEYVVAAGCPPIKGSFELIFVDSEMIDNSSLYDAFSKKSLRNVFLVVDGIKGKKMLRQNVANDVLSNKLKAKGLVFANQDKFTWSVATEWDAFPVLYILKGSLKRHQLQIKLNVEPDLHAHNTQNVVGFVKGTAYPDSFVVFSAHYDHLGMMGKWAIFPGANDNASGVAMMLDLMNYYSKNPAPYSIAFMAFAGEEAGLFGSYYYTQHPLFDLKKISMLINLDLMGTGDKGMTVVNATLFPKEFMDIQTLNIINNYLPTVNSRGKAQNSDHYWFSENGVKAFFFYLMGEYHFYHDIQDTSQALTLAKYEEAFQLIRDFVNEYTEKK
jgi:hypothetical protein